MAASLSLRRGQTTRVLYELCRDVEHCEYPNESHPRQIALTVQHADGFGNPYNRAASERTSRRHRTCVLRVRRVLHGSTRVRAIY